MDNSEQYIVENLLRTALSQIRTIRTHIDLSHYTDNCLENHKYAQSTKSNNSQSQLNARLKASQQALWKQLSFPSLPTKIRDL
jgi:hypothetical protein